MQVGIDALTALQGADRTAKSYAFLYAAFRGSETAKSPVRDALDCLIPFIVPYLTQTAGKQLDLVALQGFLSQTYGFEIPLYALEQVAPTLAESGYLDYRRNTKIYIAKSADDKFSIAKEELETDFNEITGQLSSYAESLGVTISIPSKTWDQALINFLKSKPSEVSSKLVTIKGVLMSPKDIEQSTVAAFIKNLHENNYHRFEGLLRIFMGILIEEFISSVSEIGSNTLPDLTVFYDTSVLMRSLGCSGKLHKSATEELTKSLQALDVKIKFFSGNEAELHGILDAIVTVKDVGGELYGETAEAISQGEVRLADIRLMQNSVAEHLGAKGILPADSLEGGFSSSINYQIDEKGFAHYLFEAAQQQGRVYGVQNRNNDASFLGHVMRLRAGVKTRDLASCRYLFVTTNRLFASASRRYLIRDGSIKGFHCPPVLHICQVATIAWLLKDHKLEPAKAGRELLANCYAAVRPDAEWFKNFREGIERVVGDLELYATDTANNVTLQAARRIAQEETFGNAALVRNLNAAELLSRAKKAADQHLADTISAERQAGMRAAEAASESARLDAITLRDRADEARARRYALQVSGVTKWMCIALFLLFAGLFQQSALFGGSGVGIAAVQIIFFAPTALSILDLFGFPIVRPVFEKYENLLFELFLKLMTS